MFIAFLLFLVGCLLPLNESAHMLSKDMGTHTMELLAMMDNYNCNLGHHTYCEGGGVVPGKAIGDLRHIETTATDTCRIPDILQAPCLKTAQEGIIETLAITIKVYDLSHAFYQVGTKLIPSG